MKKQGRKVTRGANSNLWFGWSSNDRREIVVEIQAANLVGRPRGPYTVKLRGFFGWETRTASTLREAIQIAKEF